MSKDLHSKKLFFLDTQYQDNSNEIKSNMTQWEIYQQSFWNMFLESWDIFPNLCRKQENIFTKVPVYYVLEWLEGLK